MITLNHEQLIPLRRVPQHLPLRPSGKCIHPSAVYRWVSNGIRGTMLESVRIGGTVYTSAEALQRFADRLTLSASVRECPMNESDQNDHQPIEMNPHPGAPNAH